MYRVPTNTGKIREVFSSQEIFKILPESQKIFGHPGKSQGKFDQKIIFKINTEIVNTVLFGHSYIKD